LRERLSKYISRNGVASRRKAEAIIKAGRVKVNNQEVVEPYLDIDPQKDHVTVDNISISKAAPKKLYIALYKPRGYISDLADPRGRPIARDLIAVSLRLYPVGRLDFASEGLMVFTNDGDFADKVLHPRNHIDKEYQVKLQKPLSEAEIHKLTIGRRFQGILYRLRSVKMEKLTEKNAWYNMIATEGRNRMIRKLANSLGHEVLKLRRVRIGPIALGSLKPGQYRHLSTTEIAGILGSTDEA
jgi:23S rRNA pseudouridine2605 synthase